MQSVTVMRGELGNVPVRPTRLITVSLCAESKNGLALARIVSKRDIFAFFAASCAARNRATRCSGVSAPNDGPLDPVGSLGPPVPGAGENLELVALAAPEANFEEACGVVAVNRVADEAVRSPFLAAMVDFLYVVRAAKVSTWAEQFAVSGAKKGSP